MKYLIAILITAITILAYFSATGIQGVQPEEVGFLETPQELADCNTDKDNCISSNAITEYHSMRPWKSSNSSSNPLEQIARIIAKDSQAKIIIQKENYLYAQYTSKFFQFIDDVEFLLTKNEIIHFRSASRIGKKDLGINRQRLEKIRSSFLSDQKIQ